MSGKSNFLDYEPLRGPRKVNAVNEDEFTWTKNRTETEDFEEVHQPLETKTYSETSAATSTTEPAKTARDDSELWILKKGHSISFFGVFLFTCLLFLRPYDWSRSLSWLSSSALITGILTLVIFVPTQLGLENRLTIRLREVNLVLLLLLLCLLSVPFALDKLQAWNGIIEYVKIVAIFVVLVNVLRTEKRLKAMLLLGLVTSLLLSLGAIRDFSGQQALAGNRITGVLGNLFDNPNDLAIYLVTFFPILIGLALGVRSRVAKLLYAGSAIVVLGGIVATFSRGGFIGLLFVVGTLVWRFGRKNRIVVSVVGIVLLTGFLAFAPGAYRERIVTKDGSSESRTGELKRSVFLALRHPVFGVGMNNFILYSDTSHATHNAYTQVAAENGLLAGLIYLLFLVAAVKRVSRIPNPHDLDRSQKRYGYLAIGLHASLIGYMVVSFFASVAFLWYVYYLVGYSICVTRLYERSQVDQQQSPPSDLIT